MRGVRPEEQLTILLTDPFTFNPRESMRQRVDAMLLRRAGGNKVWLMKNRFTAIIERGRKYLIATCAEVPEAAGQGKTRAAALRDLSASIQSVLEFRREEALAKAASDAERTVVEVP